MTGSHESAREHVSRICLGLPGADREIQGDHATFRIRGKPFAYFLNNHHGDGIVSVCCRVLPGDNTRLAAADPSRFYLPAYIGPRGWVGLRLDRGEIDWEEVEGLVGGSYELASARRPRPGSQRGT